MLAGPDKRVNGFGGKPHEIVQDCSVFLDLTGEHNCELGTDGWRATRLSQGKDRRSGRRLPRNQGRRSLPLAGRRGLPGHKGLGAGGGQADFWISGENSLSRGHSRSIAEALEL